MKFVLLNNRLICWVTVLATTLYASTVTCQSTNDATTGDNNATAVDCSAFQSTLSLSNDLTMSYVVNVPAGANVSAGTMTVQLEYAGEAWIALGFSKSGSMVGSTAVIGLPSNAVSSTNPGKYNLTGQTTSGVFLMDSSQQTLQNASITQQGGVTTMTFTKLLSETGELEILGNGKNIFIWAVGYTNDLNQHKSKGGVQIALAPCGSTDAGSNDVVEQEGGLSDDTERTLWKTHGTMAGIAWTICVPLAVSSAYLRGFFLARGYGGIWFTIHRTLNMMAFLLTLGAFSIAVYVYKQQGDAHFKGTHQAVGFVITIMVSVQAFMGILRPHAPAPPTKKLEGDHEIAAEVYNGNEGDHSKPTKARLAWEATHKLFGVFLLFLALWQVQSGILLYAGNFGTHDYTKLFWGGIGALGGVVWLLNVYVKAYL